MKRCRSLETNNPRAPLIKAMSDAAASGIHCGNCVGTCCTYVANSMQIDEAEALTLKNWLVSQDRWNDDLLSKLNDCIEEYRLDREISNRPIRRTYTCPFYSGSTLGCTVSRSAKPYGCLAFNPREAGVSSGGNCRSDQSLLESLKTPVVGEKHPIPIALLRLR